jgi:hypothetical protein
VTNFVISPEKLDKLFNQQGNSEQERLVNIDTRLYPTDIDNLQSLSNHDDLTSLHEGWRYKWDELVSGWGLSTFLENEPLNSVNDKHVDEPNPLYISVFCLAIFGLYRFRNKLLNSAS